MEIFLLASPKDQKTVQRDMNKDNTMGNNERSYWDTLWTSGNTVRYTPVSHKQRKEIIYECYICFLNHHVIKEQKHQPNTNERNDM